MMSCNGCRVLRKGCSQGCILRPCLEWIQLGALSQGYATLFLAKFFGRADLMSFISAVPNHQRPALFQSLLFEACGRTINPVNGAVGLLSSGNWHLCQAAVDTVLRGGSIRPFSHELLARALAAPPRPTAGQLPYLINNNSCPPPVDPAFVMRFWPSDLPQTASSSFRSVLSGTTSEENDGNALCGQQNKKLLNLFV